MSEIYNFLLTTSQRKAWEKIGIKRKAGIIVPLFFIWSKESFGIGEISDLKILIDWCKNVGFKIIQLLPLNDTGFDVSPYNLQSAFALNSLYLSLRRFLFKSKLKEIKKERVDYRIKKEKLKILKKIFLKTFKRNSDFEVFETENKYWLEDYALYRCLKEKFGEKSWENWPKVLKQREKSALLKIKRLYKKEIDFQKWLQWEIFKELKEIKKYAEKKKVFIMGDFPWLIGRDSAEAWTKRQYFDLNFSAGAPPDEFSKKGQRWGMPPLFWEKIFEDEFFYFKERLKYLQNFYHLLRIDHVIGFFRTWKIPISEPQKNKGKNGFFDLDNESLWEERGEKILREMINSTQSLICAEDLGKIPFCLPKVLNKLGIPGIKVLRWTKKDSEAFLKAKDYPALSIATLSTHDTSNFLSWFEKETSSKEKKEILKLLEVKKFSQKEIIFEALKFIHETNSIFSINLLIEWLFLTNYLKKNPSFYRINFPAKILKTNWTLKSPISLEQLTKSNLSEKIRTVLEKTKRI